MFLLAQMRLTVADLPFVVNENTRKVPALDFPSSHPAMRFPPQISVWFDTALPCVFPSSHGIYCDGMDKENSWL